MNSRRFFLSTGLAITVCLGAVPAAPPTAENSVGQLEEAWQAEIRGEGDVRKSLLRAVLNSSPDSREARWQLGQVEHNGAWINYADLPDQWAADRALAEYRSVRDQREMTYKDQLDLANWCRSRGLSEREQAHLTAALQLSDNPNDPVLRNRLGHRLSDGEWKAQAELEKLQQSRVDFQKNLKKWKPKIQKLAKMLGSSRSTFHRQAKDELKAITDPAALPAMEMVLGQADLQAGKLLVDILGPFPSHQAADSLARLAVLSPWDPVRQEAIKQLRSRPFASYVPELLATLRTPVASKIQLMIGSGGVHLMAQFTSETQTAQQVVDRRSSKYIVTRSNSGNQSITGPQRDRNRVARATANAALEAQLQALDAEKAADAQKAKTEEWNQRVCEVLKEATGYQLPADPVEWWSWWSDYNQMTEEDKEYQYVCYEETDFEVVEVDLPTVAMSPVIGDLQSIDPPRECLVAGTPIWTDRGAVPVESVQVGDLVLAKHPETGELKYQPVLRTTIREAEPIMKVTTEGGEIRATGGHTFWISGAGWTKLRDVKPGQQFHGANGPVEIQRLEKDGTEKTYNLLVANSHTYFVGPELVLSHDVTMAEPVDALIPGFVKR